MANHVRQQIREAVAVVLTGLATTGANVFQSRVYRLTDDELPGLLITTDQEDIVVEGFELNPITHRTLQLTVVGLAKGNVNLDDTLDKVIKEVEVAINVTQQANTLGGLVKGITLSSIGIEFDGDFERPIGQAVMIFSVDYYTQAAVPDVSI